MAYLPNNPDYADKVLTVVYIFQRMEDPPILINTFAREARAHVGSLVAVRLASKKLSAEQSGALARRDAR